MSLLISLSVTGTPQESAQGTSYGTQILTAYKVDELPKIDGESKDKAWVKAKEIVVYDRIANIEVSIKSVYNNKGICFLVQFPDPDESRSHKSWVWDKELGIYMVGSDREDTFQFVWSMEKDPVDLSIHAGSSYKADVWYWKAFRTDPIGFADDKIHYFSDKKTEKATKLVSKTGRAMYLLRRGDSGSPAYKSKIYEEYQDGVVVRFIHQKPTESRADVKAKGSWQKNKWTIEFRRALKTGYSDDIQFDINQEYIFGVSRYEIAGRKPNPQLTQPLYGGGDVTDILRLKFEK